MHRTYPLCCSSKLWVVFKRMESIFSAGLNHSEETWVNLTTRGWTHREKRRDLKHYILFSYFHRLPLRRLP